MLPCRASLEVIQCHEQLYAGQARHWPPYTASGSGVWVLVQLGPLYRHPSEKNASALVHWLHFTATIPVGKRFGWVRIPFLCIAERGLSQSSSFFGIVCVIRVPTSLRALLVHFFVPRRCHSEYFGSSGDPTAPFEEVNSEESAQGQIEKVSCVVRMRRR